MLESPEISRMCVYPIKSLDGIEVSKCQLFPAGGGLWRDRMWAIFNHLGEIVTGKTEPRIFKIRARFSDDFSQVSLERDGVARAFSLLGPDFDALNLHLSEILEQQVWLRSDSQVGYPDYSSNPGPSIVSKASLAAVCTWFPDLNLAEARRRFRASIEIDGVPAFWEDCLFQKKGEPRRFLLGDVVLHGMGPIMRCPVPTRDPDTGDIQKGFQRQFMKNRTLTFSGRAGIETARLEGAYYLAVKTQVPDSKGKFLQVGDTLRLF